MASSGISGGPVRLESVEGYLGRKNDIIYHPSKCQYPSGCVVFFGGDMQNYKEVMLAHRDNKRYAEWDLESTAILLNSHFPDQAVIVVKPSKMALMTFSCYQNFVDVNNFGAPTYEKNTCSLKHLWLLLQNTASVIQGNVSETEDASSDSSQTGLQHLTQKPLTLIGFSKGCVVLNQFLYSLHSSQGDQDEGIKMLINNISSMYWLEGGHSGVSSTWITDRTVLQSFSNLKIDVHIHVTPYQVNCDTRARIGKEEKIFREYLCRMNMNVTRKLHFPSESRSLEQHFRVLKVFK